MKYAKVAVSEVTFWVDRPYDYLIPSSLEAAALPGARVIVPFSRANRRAEGVILSVSDQCAYASPKALESVLDESPVLTPFQLSMALWMRERFFCTVYEAIKAMLPAGLWFKSDGSRRVKDKQTEFLRLEVSGEEAMALAAQKASRARAQSAVLRLLAVIGEGSVAEVRALTGAGRPSIQPLLADGVLSMVYKESFRRPAYRVGQSLAALPTLTQEQQTAFDGLKALCSGGTAGGALLYGVTGSGKTAVYIHLISHVLQQGRAVLLLVPEIALTPQMLETFSSYFGDEIAVLHSSLSLPERYDEWKRVRSGSARLIIGTRSAIFAPAEDVGLIIIDEEQEDTYKSETAPRYHARDVAKFRCADSGALLLLGSATPDVATRYSAEIGRYAMFSLNKRYNRMALPAVQVVDLKRELRSGNGGSISGCLREELKKNLDSGEQSILFLNRRGSAKLITCIDCGHTFRCPNCSVNLTYHARSGRLLCHTCGYSRRPAERCPECGGELKYTGDGTERIEEQLGELFPGVRCLRVDTDTVAEAGGHEPLFSRFREENIPVMIGTQMVTKGLNFEHVTLVGVLLADQSLYAGDYRASERCFSLITQVIGRSGRASRSGRAVIQTFTPDNEVIRCAAAQDYDAFYRQEIDLRRIQRCPPFSQLVTLTVVGGDESQVLKSCVEIKRLLQRSVGDQPGTEVLGPAPYPVYKVAGKYRYKLTLRTDSDSAIHRLVTKVLNYCNQERAFRGISVYADRNPLE